MPDVSVASSRTVGERTIAIELDTPAGFEAHPGQFVLVRESIGGEEESGYYTISSPDVEGTFEITVAVDPDGTLGPWLDGLGVGDTVGVEGPYGNVQYTGDGDAVVLAGGPGIGPAVGIAELALRSGNAATVVYGGTEPPHADRLDGLEAEGATVVVSGDLAEATRGLEFTDAQVYVFGFEGFVTEARETLAELGLDPGDLEIESFGPE